MSARPRPESVENTSPDYEIEDNSECFASGSDEISLKGNLVDYIRTLVRNEANWNGSSNGSSDTTDKEKQGSESDFASDSDDESQQKSHEKDESIIDLNGLRYELYTKCFILFRSFNFLPFLSFVFSAKSETE